MELNPDYRTYFYILFLIVIFELFIRGVQGRKSPPIRLGYCIGENAISISLYVLGDRLGLIGPNGSGKTTMLNLIGCLDKPTKGKVFIGKEQVDTFDRRKRAAFRGSTLGFIFQAFNLFPVLTTYENVEYPLVMIKNEPVSKRKEMVLKVLESVGMLDQKDKFPDQL